MTSSSALKNLITTCALTTLIFNTVETYTCAQCYADCHPGALNTCETSQGCINQRQELVDSGLLTGRFDMKDCSSSTCVPLDFSVSMGKGFSWGYVHKCCQSDRCNQENVLVPQKSSEPNGITCPACFNKNNMGSCNPVSFACTGRETKCIKIVGSANPGFVIAMGCATETACNLKSMFLGGIEASTSCVN